MESNNILETSESTESSSFSRYNKSKNLIDAMYAKMIVNDENAKKLDEQINTSMVNYYKKSSELKDQFKKEEQYFDEAFAQINQIKDSVNKKEMMKLFEPFYQKLKDKKAPLFKIEAEIIKANSKLFEAYKIYKLKKTLPEVEKHQNEKKITLDSLKKELQKQKILLEKVQQLK